MAAGLRPGLRAPHSWEMHRGTSSILTLANGLSASRLVLGPLCAFAHVRQWWVLAAVTFAAAAASDFADGRVARGRGQASAFGGLLDHASDAVFVVVVLCALAFEDWVPLALPLLVAAAFVQYTWDSRVLAGAPLRASVLGRANGIAYFVLTGAAATGPLFGLHDLVARWLWLPACLLIASTVLSMLDRLHALLRSRRAE